MANRIRRRAMSLPYRTILLLALLVAFGCSNRSRRPQAPTAVEATGRFACGDDGPSGGAAPLIVDLAPEERSDLEIAMQRHVSVVSWDCKALRVLPDCFVEGTYQYQGTSPKHQLVRLFTTDEVMAALPLSGSRLVGELGVDFSSGTSLDLALIMVGKRSTAQVGLSVEDLRGNCAGASHVVRSATLGAFTLATGERAQARSVVDLFGPHAALKTESGKTTFLRDGTLEACNPANASGVSAPANCDAALRVELVPLEAPPPVLTILSMEEAARYHGRFCSDIPECERLCAIPDGDACANLALVYYLGDRVTRDLRRASSLMNRACSLGVMTSCTILGTSLLTENSSEVARGRVYLTRACDRGQVDACNVLALSYQNSGELERARVYAERACELGHASACKSR